MTTQTPIFAEGSEAMVRLESYVDHVGLANVLWALESICDAKAQHIEENWQDKALARAWQLEARRCGAMAKAVNLP